MSSTTRRDESPSGSSVMVRKDGLALAGKGDACFNCAA
uniref:Uncharacterized protein n=1 Tax=Arundo donax TaxID=35708 RepID=A0A0A8Z958_ARUDO